LATHLRFARPPILLLIVTICQFRILIWSSSQLPSQTQSESHPPAQPVLNILLSLLYSSDARLRLQKRINCTHQSSGSSSIACCAAAVRVLSSVDIFLEEPRFAIQIAQVVWGCEFGTQTFTGHGRKNSAPRVNVTTTTHHGDQETECSRLLRYRIRVNFINTMLTLVQEMVARLNPFATASTRFGASCHLHTPSFPFQARR
jgi:hypothetical protein